MVRQRVAVSDARRVEQKSVEDVLIHLGAVVIWQWMRWCSQTSFSSQTTKERFLGFDVVTCLPSVEEERQRRARVCRDGQRLPEGPESPAAVLPADLSNKTTRC